MIFADIVKWLYDYDKRVLVLMDREQLVQQTAERLHEYLGAQIGIACASLKRRNVGFGVTCASRQTLAPMLRNGNADAKFNLVILDEAHLYNERKSGQYAQILAKLWENHKDMRVFGCTATPYNLRGNIYGVGKLFETVDFRITAEEMIQQGYLVPLQWKVRRSDMLRQLDLVEKSSTGELDESQQSAVLEQKIFVDSVYDIWSQYARDRMLKGAYQVL